ncbi:Uncharacterised protein [Trueperella bialowiezensis]|uniref:Uncharacterized protein n=1 Tax=Trueperella bialowiezensis TaxID=312285 RepID=A0A448PC47_9ACTO|nr:Uncharacterised protein [Trueperella bialowiezensis]
MWLLSELPRFVNDAQSHLLEFGHVLARVVSAEKQVARYKRNTHEGLRVTGIATISGCQYWCFNYSVHTMIKA